MTDPIDEAVAIAIEPVDAVAPAPEEAGNAVDETPEPDALPETEEAKAEKTRSGYARKKEALELSARENAELKLRIASLERSYEEAQAKLKPPAPIDPGAEPEFGANGLDDPEAFWAAQKQWIKDATAYAKHQGQVEFQEQLTHERQEQDLARTRATVTAREEQLAKTHPDYLQVISPYTQAILSSPVLSDYIARSAQDGALGLQVVYELAKRPELLERVVTGDPFTAQRILLQAEAALTSPAPSKPATKAAPPINPIGGGSEVARKSPEDESMDEYAARRAREMKTKP